MLARWIAPERSCPSRFAFSLASSEWATRVWSVRLSCLERRGREQVVPLRKRLSVTRAGHGLRDVWLLTLLVGAGAITACDRTPPVVNQVEAAAENFADDIGLTDGSEDVRVFFALGSSTLQPEARARLDAVASRYASLGDPGITLTGYADRSGDAAANLALSEQRAASVKDYLQQRGVPAGSIEIEARGERQPRVSTGDDVSERANRRVRVTIDEQ